MHFLTLSYIWGIQWISLWYLQKIFVMFYTFTSVLVTFVYHFYCHCKFLRKEREDGYFNFLNVSHLSMCSHFHFIMLHWLLPNPAAFGVCYLSKLKCISDAPVYLDWNSFYLFLFFKCWKCVQAASALSTSSVWFTEWDRKWSILVVICLKYWSVWDRSQSIAVNYEITR